MMGGGELIAWFLDAGEIEGFDIHVIPTLIGEGIPLGAPPHLDVPLRLRSARNYPDGVVRLRYEVARQNL
jgi:dihydrofolate reductase